MLERVSEDPTLVVCPTNDVIFLWRTCLFNFHLNFAGADAWESFWGSDSSCLSHHWRHLDGQLSIHRSVLGPQRRIWLEFGNILPWTNLMEMNLDQTNYVFYLIIQFKNIKLWQQNDNVYTTVVKVCFLILLLSQDAGTWQHCVCSFKID